MASPPIKLSGGFHVLGDLYRHPDAIHGGRVLVLTLAALLAPARDGCAQATIASDRPGLGTGAVVLETGTIQLEVGVERTVDKNGQQLNIGQAVLRWGFGVVELQTYANSFVVGRSDGIGVDGLEDLGFGAKIPILSRENDSLEIAALTTVTLPTGTTQITNGAIVPAAALLVDQSLSETWGLGTTVGVAAEPDGQKTISTTVTPILSLPGSLDVDVYAGYGGFFTSDSHSHFVEAGVQFIANANLQLDVNGGVDIETGAYFVGIGVARRWGWKAPGTLPEAHHSRDVLTR